jgi:hypothetical protein
MAMLSWAILASALLQHEVAQQEIDDFIVFLLAGFFPDT